MLSSGEHVTTGEVMTREAGSASSLGPCSVKPRTMSRSEIKPRTVLPSPLTTRAPMPFSFSSHETVNRLVAGDVVATLAPLAFKIDATFMILLSHSKWSPRRRNDAEAPRSRRPLAPRYLSAFTCHRDLGSTAFDPAAIENHLGVRLVRKPLQQIVVARRMLHRHDEYVPHHLVLIAQPTLVEEGLRPLVTRERRDRRRAAYLPQGRRAPPPSGRA